MSILNIIYTVAPFAIMAGVPILLGALGGLFSERSGIINVGIEGLMVVGGFGYALTYFFLVDKLNQNMTLLYIICFIAAIIVGCLFSLLLSFASITLNANQVIAGTALNMLAPALTLFLCWTFTDKGIIRVQQINTKDIAGLKDIPFIGDILFTKTYPTTWLAIIILIASWFVLYKTSFGLRLRSCGEHPQASSSVGINVRRMRYIAVTIGGALAALGGAVIVATYNNEFNGAVNGVGFLALAALIFGQWSPFKILAATVFFGVSVKLSVVASITPGFAAIPSIFIDTFPYIVTIIALIVSSKSSKAPKAEGEIFDESKR